ncbi:MAG: 50S ribosomal protein L11 methyltransferase [Desulfobulbaceae bacterium]|jgi:ribosomal protein L11 methyltransferase|nr:50S ribosomal protein L11 methyltransferase [Desulfobulbaceae bacterium]
MKTVSSCLCLTIDADVMALDAIGDFCLGVFNAAVEQSADRPVLRVFLALPENPAAIVTQLENYCQQLAKALSIALPRVSWKILPAQDWGSRWKEHFHPFTLTPGLVIAPTWKEYAARPTEKVIVMDPGMAFGTGHHATTSMAAALLLETVAAGAETVLDVGCGTGILAMAAALFGAGQVLAIDNDPLAVTAARENVARNDLSAKIGISGDNLSSLSGNFHIVIANIVYDVLLDLALDMVRLTAPGGALILSGILAGKQEESIIRHFAALGCIGSDQRRQNEWAALRLHKNFSHAQ